MSTATRTLAQTVPAPPTLATRVTRAARATLCAFASTAAGALVVIAVVHLVGLTSWPFELLHHFLVAYGFAAAALAICAFALKAVRLAVIACGLALFFAGAYARSAVFFEGGDAQGTRISMVTNNVYCRNWDADGLRAWLATRPADIVALEEVPPNVERALAPLAPPGGSTYPYSASIPASSGSGRGMASGCEGILLLSTVPIVSTRVYHSDNQAWPALLAQLDVPGTGSAWLVLVHAADPLRASGLLLRDQFLASLVPVVTALSGPVIVAGDFNATPFTPAFQRFVTDARLLPQRGLPGTYPADLGPFGLPIDHILVRDADLTPVEALAARGSDHRPIFANIVLPSEASPLPVVARSPENSR